MLIKQIVAQVSIEHTCNTYFVMYIDPHNLFRRFLPILDYTILIFLQVTLWGRC